MKVTYKDPNKTVDERVEDLLSRMTTAEKAAQVIQIPYSEVSKEEALEWAERGAGSFLHVLGDNARRLQDIALSGRLGIPILFGIDAIHGHGLHRGGTIFPSQLAIAASFHPGLVKEIGWVTAREVAADGLHWTFSPVLCLGRDTRWGRIDETFGEDSFLAGELGAAMIKGYQGNDLSADDSILACAKHYLGYGEAVGARDAMDTEITFRKMREIFLPPFQKAVEAGCATVMTAYGSIDGTPFTISEKSLKTVLKEELGFDGFVVTDWDNVGSLIRYQHVAANMEEASLLAVKSGNDMLMSTPAAYESVLKLVESGALAVSYLEEAVRRILRIKFRMGLFERPEKRGSKEVFGCKEHLEICLRASRESMVLLENRDRTLPLSAKIRSVAVIGPNADNIRAQYGDWTYFTHPKPDWNIQSAEPYYTVLSGMKEIAGAKGVRIQYHQGCDVLNDEDADLQGAAAIGAQCDAIVLVLGDCYDQFGEYKDRADLSLSGKQQALFDELRKLNRPLVTVLVASKPLCIPAIAEQTDALITNFNGGQYGGMAVAEAIFGKLNPSGKLPISFPVHTGQLPVYYNQLPGWHGGKYCDMPQEPLYAFGYGLSYTQFTYSDLKIDVDTWTAAVTVKNIGACDGMETVQLYFRDVISSVMTPVKQLIAFEKISLAVGERKIVSFKLDQSAFSLVDIKEQRVTEAGRFILMAGGDSREDSLIRTEFSL